jgi:hypothetical protein
MSSPGQYFRSYMYLRLKRGLTEANACLEDLHKLMPIGRTYKTCASGEVFQQLMPYIGPAVELPQVRNCKGSKL